MVRYIGSLINATLRENGKEINMTVMHKKCVHINVYLVNVVTATCIMSLYDKL